VKDLVPPLVRRTHHVLRPDPKRLVSAVFLPGQDVPASGKSQSAAVLDRILALSEDQVAGLMAATTTSFARRHLDLAATLEARFAAVAHLLADAQALSPVRRRLIGAYFSKEYAIEAAGLFNPSMVAHPDQSGLPAGTVRFVMSVRAVGEGHISSVEFRSGTIDRAANLTFDPVSGLSALPTAVPTVYSKTVFGQQFSERSTDHDSARIVLDVLPETFVRADLDRALARLREFRLTPRSAVLATEHFEWIAACNYSVTFPASSSLTERVIMPGSPSESHGLEDLRLVLFTDGDGRVEYRGAYTAFDGNKVAAQLLRTEDFITFHLSQLGGSAADNKGLALFPRPVQGRQLALSRRDLQNNSLAASPDGKIWNEVATVQTPREAWELVQIGNCGPPLETPFGWLVLTHGVGPLREYSIGAILLDLDDPRRVIGRLSEPLLTPAEDERDGYVPNVLYSCGALVHDDLVALPYGCSDASVRIALIDLPALIQSLQHPGPPA
jgi:predicted GH43/DUF377 family glycosyl hydrolase